MLQINIFGIVNELFSKYVDCLQSFYENSCSNPNCENNGFKEAKYLELLKKDNMTYLIFVKKNIVVIFMVIFHQKLVFSRILLHFWIDSNISQEIYIQEIPKRYIKADLKNDEIKNSNLEKR